MFGGFHFDPQMLDLLHKLIVPGMFSTSLSLGMQRTQLIKPSIGDFQLRAEKSVVHLCKDLARPQ